MDHYRKLFLSAVGAVVLAITGFAVPASAATSTPSSTWCGWTPANDSHTAGTFNAAGVNIRSGQYTNCVIYGEGYEGDAVDLRCYADGTSVGGDTHWIYLTDETTGVTGWSSIDFLYTYGGGVVHC